MNLKKRKSENPGKIEPQTSDLPTVIYWLFDVRPETIESGHSLGKPFYCGKTTMKATERLSKHKTYARRKPHRELSRRLMECGEHIEIRIMETVSPGEDWAIRERHWISQLRSLCSDSTNVRDGGDAGRPKLNLVYKLIGFRAGTIEEVRKSHDGTFISFVRKAILAQLEIDEAALKETTAP